MANYHIKPYSNIAKIGLDKLDGTECSLYDNSESPDGILIRSTKLAEGDNLAYTTDFRRVYQTLISGWLEHEGSQDILRGEFKTFDMFS